MTSYRFILLLFLGTFSLRIFATHDVFCSYRICMPSGRKSTSHDVFCLCDDCMTIDLVSQDLTAADPKRPKRKNSETSKTSSNKAFSHPDLPTQKSKEKNAVMESKRVFAKNVEPLVSFLMESKRTPVKPVKALLLMELKPTNAKQGTMNH